MKKRFTEEQIVKILAELRTGKKSETLPVIIVSAKTLSLFGKESMVN
jgi:hypothetical protein